MSTGKLAVQVAHASMAFLTLQIRQNARKVWKYEMLPSFHVEPFTEKRLPGARPYKHGDLCRFSQEAYEICCSVLRKTTLKKRRRKEIMSERIWDGTEVEFVKLVQWAMVFRKLAKKRTPGWLETALNQIYVEKLAEMYGYTEDAVVEMMKSIENPRKPDESLRKAISRTFEESIAEMMDRYMPLFCTDLSVTAEVEDEDNETGKTNCK